MLMTQSTLAQVFIKDDVLHGYQVLLANLQSKYFQKSLNGAKTDNIHTIRIVYEDMARERNLRVEVFLELFFRYAS